MSSYISVIRESFAFFPLIALLFTIPYILWNYHKYGSVWSIRILIVYSFILYMMTVVFLTSLPLPSRESVAAMTIPRYNLDPFAVIRDIREEVSVIPDDPATWIALIHSDAFREFAANILMCIPFGMYMRYYFKQKLGISVLLTFLFSLFLETTQLTGLWFLYPRNYRLFDVDDLISNTLGGFIGYLIMIPLGHLLPSRRRIDQVSYERGEKISLLRRLIALGTDLFFYAAAAVVAGSLWPLPHLRFLFYLLLISVVFSTLLAWLSGGRTLGLLLMSMKVTDQNGQRASFGRLFVRYLLEYGILIGIPGLIQTAAEKVSSHRPEIILICAAAWLLLLIISQALFLSGRQSLSGSLSGTRLVSSIHPPQQQRN